MGFGESDFQKIFLKNFFKEILKEKEQLQIHQLDDVCKILADLHVKEFGSGNYPYAIISKHGTVENWLRNKIDEINL